jgi:hypothetical protein
MPSGAETFHIRCEPSRIERSSTIESMIPKCKLSGVISMRWNVNRLALLALSCAAGIQVFGQCTFNNADLFRPALAASGPAASADFNGDGKVDLVFADTYSNVEIALGDGTGRFGTPAAYSLTPNAYARAIAAGDFNKDGKVDVAVVDSTFNKLVILPGDGAGHLGTPASYSISGVTSPAFLTVGDMNADGYLDVVVGDYNGLQLLKGAAGGTFGASSTITTLPIVSALFVDLSGDGKADLVAAESYPNTVLTFISNGTSFAAPTSYSVTFEVRAFAAADLNNDAKMDFVAGGEDSGESEQFVEFLSSTSAYTQRTFNGSNPSPDAAHYKSGVANVFLGDVDGDGDRDLIALNQHGVDVFTNSGGGTFAVAQKFAAGPSGTVGDFNGDGKTDVAVSGLYPGMLMFLSGGSGIYAAPQTITMGAVFATQAIATGDFNGDGKPDLQAITFTPDFNLPTLAVRLGNGDGTFGGDNLTDTGYSQFGQPYGVADYNKDGRLDVALAGGVAVSGGVPEMFLGQGNGTFDSGTMLNIANGEVASITADFNGDGNLDFVTSQAGGGSNGTSPGQLSLILGNGNGTFGNPRTFSASPTPRGMVAGDFNRDGKLDIIVADDVPFPGISFFAGDGAGNFAARTTISLTQSDDPVSVVSGDFNKDGRLDIAVLCQRTIQVYLGGTTSLFTAGGVVQLDYGAATLSIAAADLNGDGNLDLVVADTQVPVVFELLGNGGGAFGLPIPFYVNGLQGDAIFGTIQQTFAIADFNHDGKLDVAVGSHAYGPGITLLMASCPQLAAPTNFVATATSHGAASLSWNAVTNATSYDIVRTTSVDSTYAKVATVSTTTFTDTTVSADTTYLYKVRATGSSNYSAIDIATTVVYSRASITAGLQARATDLTETRAAVNMVRKAATLAPYTFTDSSLTGTRIKAVHINELRIALNEAREYLNLSLAPFTDPTITPGTTKIKATHVQQIRDGTK